MALRCRSRSSGYGLSTRSTAQLAQREQGVDEAHEGDQAFRGHSGILAAFDAREGPVYTPANLIGRLQRG